MTRPASPHPTELELEILKQLWRDGPSPVRTVRDGLAGTGRDLAYTSVMTVMNIMVDKGYLKRVKRGASFVYRPVARERQTTGKMLKDLLDRAFGGSPAAAVLSLIETSELSEDELQKLRDLVARSGRPEKADDSPANHDARKE